MCGYCSAHLQYYAIHIRYASKIDLITISFST
nr:MAG TPA: hypothetical protein [Caudoviricetes sp.]